MPKAIWRALIVGAAGLQAATAAARIPQAAGGRGQAAAAAAAAVAVAVLLA